MAKIVNQLLWGSKLHSDNVFFTRNTLRFAPLKIRILELITKRHQARPCTEPLNLQSREYSNTKNSKLYKCLGQGAPLTQPPAILCCNIPS